MAITFGQARLQLAQYAGRGGLCADDDEVALFVKEVLQYLLFKGPQAALKTYCFQAHQGCITIPHELEVPLRVSIDNHSGSVWSGWFKYYDTANLDAHCVPAARALTEVPGYFPTVYEIPKGGAKVGVMGTCREDADAHVIVKGLDATGREIFTDHKGEQISGEYLSIVKGQIRTTSVKFSKITHVVKSKTLGYVQLLAVVPDLDLRHFLADYSPLEEIPQYRRFRLTMPCPDKALVNVMGRIRLKENYADSDVLPIENIHLLKVAAQGLQAEQNNNPEIAQAKNKLVMDLMTEENEYKNVSTSQPLDVFHATSPGVIRNVISRRFDFRRWWR